MDIVGIDISKATFDVALLLGKRVKHAVFSNTETGFGQLLLWLIKHRPDPAAPMHACMEATGNWGLELADFLHAREVRVSVVNPARIKAYSDSELARNKTDKLDAGLIGRFCRAHVPPVWLPAAAHLRELRELVRRCDALKSARVQELNRQKSGFASPAVARSIAAHIEWLNSQIEAVMDEARHIIAIDATLSKNLTLVRSITGFGEVSATILLAELPTLAFHPLRGRNLGQLRQTLPTSHQKHWRPSSACRLANTAPERRCAGRARSAASARSACEAHFICAPSAPNGPISRLLPSSRACPPLASRPRSSWLLLPASSWSVRTP